MKQNRLVKGSIIKGLLAFSLPIFFVYLLNYLYPAVDFFILSLAGAEKDISNVLSAYLPINIAISLLTGTGVAATFLIGQYHGAGDEQGKLKAIKSVIVFINIVAVGLSFIIALFSPLIIQALNIHDPIAKDASLRYLLISTIIIPFNGLIYTTHAIYKGQGKSLLPFVYNSLGVSSNILFDFIFIYFLNMKSDGAAIASVLAYLFAAISIYSYIFIIKKTGNPLKNVQIDKTMIQYLAKKSFPLAIQEALVIICFSVFVSVINLRGDITSTALGISDRITNIAYVPVLAFGNTISAAVSQNLGAGDIKRTNKIVWTGVLILLIFTAIFSLPIFLFINQLANLYTENKAAIDMIFSRSWVIFFDLILCVLLTPLNALASGSGNGRWSLYVYLFSDMLIRVPLILILGLMDYPLWIVSISYPASTILGLGIILFFYFKKYWQNIEKLSVNINRYDN